MKKNPEIANNLADLAIVFTAGIMVPGYAS